MAHQELMAAQQQVRETFQSVTTEEWIVSRDIPCCLAVQLATDQSRSCVDAAELELSWVGRDHASDA
jgi:hypothetical protein